MLDADSCYAALRSRDPRFDGRFFVGVHSTGVYCRPVCPARTPRRDRVDFFRSAAEAQAAGFRACLRCRPETAPCSAAWMGTEATVRRAVRLIEAGALDRGTVPELAGRLGVSDRHLRTLFRRHLGASPAALAQARRLRTARMLLTSTPLPMHEISSAAGFNSLRRFNDAVKRAFGRPPSELRTRGGAATIQFRLPYRPPFDFEGLLTYFAQRAMPGIERVESGAWYHRVAPDDDAEVEVRHDPDRHTLLVSVPPRAAGELPDVVHRVRRVFDVDADPHAVATRLVSLPADPGVRLPGAFDPFSVAIRIVLGQQVSVKGASTLAARLVESWGWPLPEVLASAPVASIGMPRQRARAVQAVAAAVASGILDFEPGRPLDTLTRQWCALPGIGPWSAKMIALRAYAEPDAFPDTDLVLKRAIAHHSPDVVDQWRPWRAYAAMTLWRAAATETPQ